MNLISLVSLLVSSAVYADCFFNEHDSLYHSRSTGEIVRYEKAMARDSKCPELSNYTAPEMAYQTLASDDDFEIILARGSELCAGPYDCPRLMDCSRGGVCFLPKSAIAAARAEGLYGYKPVYQKPLCKRNEYWQCDGGNDCNCFPRGRL